MGLIWIGIIVVVAAAAADRWRDRSEQVAALLARCATPDDAQVVARELMAESAGLARRLGWHMPQVDRLFDLRHASRLDQIEAAAHVLGKRLEVRIA